MYPIELLKSTNSNLKYNEKGALVKPLSYYEKVKFYKKNLTATGGRTASCAF